MKLLNQSFILYSLNKFRTFAIKILCRFLFLLFSLFGYFYYFISFFSYLIFDRGLYFDILSTIFKLSLRFPISLCYNLFYNYFLSSN
jgi:hypothetical protein